MKTLKFASAQMQADKFVKTQDSIIGYIDDSESVRIHPLSSTFTYVVYNEDGTVGTFDMDAGIVSSDTDMIKLVYSMITEINALQTDVATLKTKVGGI